MTHQQIQENEIIEQYVRHELAPAERQAFQEHFFQCDECFEQVEMTARFVAGVREASRSGVLAAARTERPNFLSRLIPGVLIQGRAGRWVMPALAVSLLVVFILVGLWALSLRRENQLRQENQLLLAERAAERTAEESRAAERLQGLEAKIRELEANDSASEEQKESLRKEISRLKEQLTATERRHEAYLARLGQPEVNVPVINVYPVGDAVRTGAIGENNRLSVPRGSRTFVLILGDYTPGYSDYQLEIRNTSGRLVARREGLKPDQSGELSVMLNRTLLSQGRYRLKLYGQRQPIAEYVIEVK